MAFFMVCGSDDDPGDEEGTAFECYSGALKFLEETWLYSRSMVTSMLENTTNEVSNKATANKETHTSTNEVSNKATANKETHTSELSEFETLANRLVPLNTRLTDDGAARALTDNGAARAFTNDSDACSLQFHSVKAHEAIKEICMTINESSSINNEFSTTLYSVDIDCNSLNAMHIDFNVAMTAASTFRWPMPNAAMSGSTATAGSTFQTPTSLKALESCEKNRSLCHKPTCTSKFDPTTYSSETRAASNFTWGAFSARLRSRKFTSLKARTIQLMPSPIPSCTGVL